MKKEYSKPQLYAETFIMSEHIAGDCDIGGGATASFNKGMAQTGECFYNDHGVVLYIDSTACGKTFDQVGVMYGNDWDTYKAAMQGNSQCYNAFKSSYADSVVFSS